MEEEDQKNQSVCLNDDIDYEKYRSLFLLVFVSYERVFEIIIIALDHPSPTLLTEKVGEMVRLMVTSFIMIRFEPSSLEKE